jgi:alkylated DNA repair dioxygenase AlkB
MRDLFSEGNSLNALPMQDAEVYYLEKLALKEAPLAIMQRLISETPWRAENVVVWGKTYPQPRLIAWHGESSRIYTYSGISLNPLPWTEELLDLKRRVEVVASEEFNSVLLNYYRNNQDSMGFHSDDEKELGARPVIASLSLGTVRTFVLKHKKNKVLTPVRLKLASGSLLLMKGETQSYWKHGIAKESRWCGPRVNLTFRHIQT